MKKNKPNLRNLKWLFFFSLCIFLYANPVMGQNNRSINGSVTDGNNSFLPGVTVLEKGTSNGTVTDNKGGFRITLTGQSNILLFKMVGYKDQEVNVKGRTKVSIAMEESQKSLDEVVVVAYGTVKRSDLTGSISTLGKKDIETRVSTNPLQSLAGKVAGLNIYNNNGTPGGDMSFNIRGFSSISGSNTPLILIDGVITTNVSGYSPSDIESVSVLKDASATSIYGARGSNGVILITTKKGKKGEVSVTYDGNVSVGTQARHIDMLDASGYMELKKREWEYDPARGAYDALIKPKLHTDYPLLFNANNEPIYNTDWQEATLKSPISTRHHLAITKGDERSISGVFLGLNDDKGLFGNEFQKKYTYRLNTEYDLRPWLKVGGELNGWSVNQEITSNTNTGGVNQPRQLLEMPSLFPIQFPDGRFSTLRDFGYDTNGKPAAIYSQGNNPVALSNNSLGSSPVKASNLRLSFFTNVKLLDGLDFKSIYTNEVNSNLNYAWGSYTNIDGNGLGSASGSAGRTSAWTSDNFITYDKVVGSKHHFTTLLGAQWSSTYGQSVGASSSGYTTDFFQYNNLGVGAQPSSVSSGYSSITTNSYFGRLNYVYDNKYLVTLSSRYDGSSVFGASNKYAVFPSAALGWVLSKENFFSNSTTLSDLFSYFKIRSSYGITGNSPGAYSSTGSIGNYTINLNNQIVKGSGLGSAPNSELKWERTAQFDFGTDIRMFNDRLTLTVDGYSKKTTNLLFNVPVSVVSGYSSVTTNIGSLQNRGIEIMLGGDVIRKEDVSWNLSASFAKNNNKVLALGSTNADVISSGFLGSSTILQVGKPMGSFVGYQRIGTWGTSEAAEAAKYGRVPGDIKRLDVNHDYKFDDKDRVFLGSPFGKYDLTLSTSVRYKNWDMSMDIQIRKGNKIENVGALTVEDRTSYSTGYASVLKDAWTPTNQNTMIPALRMQADHLSTDFASYMDSHWLEDGSFVRGRSLNLSYRMPASITNKINFKNLKIYVNLDNFFLITKARDFDPEASSFGGGYATQGQTFFGTPRSRTLSLGINANF